MPNHVLQIASSSSLNIICLLNIIYMSENVPNRNCLIPVWELLPSPIPELCAQNWNAVQTAEIDVHVSVYANFKHCRDQPTVTFPIGDHVNVLQDHKKTGP